MNLDKHLEKLGYDLHKLPPEHLAVVIDVMTNLTFNERVQPIIVLVRELDLNIRETELLIEKIKNIAQCSFDRKQQQKEEK